MQMKIIDFIFICVNRVFWCLNEKIVLQFRNIMGRLGLGVFKMGYNNEDNNALSIMTYTLNSGIKSTVPLSNEMIMDWIECYKNNKKYIVNIGNETFGLNPSLVADWKVHNKYSEYRKHVECTFSTELNEAYNDAQVVVRVECKCGTKYTTITTKRKTWFCSKCKAEVFIIDDKLHDTNKGKGYIMSNKVERFKIEQGKEG